MPGGWCDLCSHAEAGRCSDRNADWPAPRGPRHRSAPPAGPELPRNRKVRAALDALARFASYAGIGDRTNLGMGVVRGEQPGDLVKVDDRARSESDGRGRAAKRLVSVRCRAFGGSSVRRWSSMTGVVRLLLPSVSVLVACSLDEGRDNCEVRDFGGSRVCRPGGVSGLSATKTLGLP